MKSDRRTDRHLSCITQELSKRSIVSSFGLHMSLWAPARYLVGSFSEKCSWGLRNGGTSPGMCLSLLVRFAQGCKHIKEEVPHIEGPTVLRLLLFPPLSRQLRIRRAPRIGCVAPSQSLRATRRHPLHHIAWHVSRALCTQIERSGVHDTTLYDMQSDSCALHRLVLSSRTHHLRLHAWVKRAPRSALHGTSGNGLLLRYARPQADDVGNSRCIRRSLSEAGTS